MKLEDMTVAQLDACFSLIVDIIDKADNNFKGNYSHLGFYLAGLQRKLLEEISNRFSKQLMTKYIEEDTTC